MTAALSLAFFLVASLGVVASLGLFDLYRRPEETASGERSRLSRLLGFTPQDLGGYSPRTLALASLAGLFLELLLIRWVSSEVRIFAYFKNFVLIACFLGFGLGFHLCRRRISLLPTLVPVLLLCALIRLPWAPLRELLALLPSWIGAFAEVHVWGVPAVDSSAEAWAGLAAAMAISVPLFALIALVFVPFGQLIGWQIEHAPNGIDAYSLNVIASLAGILLFTALAFAAQPPAVWLALAGALLAALVWAQPRLRWAVAVVFAVCLGLFVVRGAPDDTEVHWSPYQKLAVRPEVVEGETIAYTLETNDSWYQWVIDLSPAFAARHPELLRGVPLSLNAYNLPYRFVPQPPSVLVLGAGMGNDVAAALRNEAARITAVEIDPTIVSLGRRLHFERPYDDPRVTVVIDDARSYIQNADDRFDLIVFSLLDSHTTASHFSNIRIDNYVYTAEALAAARELLAPEGVFIVKFQVEQPWIAARLRALLTDVFGQPPLQFDAVDSHTTGGRFFVGGSAARIAAARADGDFDAFLVAHERDEGDVATVVRTTDDWPYFYQRAPGLPAAVLIISAILALVIWLALGRTGLHSGAVRWHFFFLGAGFLLVEAQAVSKMALLFGTTWLVNAVVIASILLLIVAANIVVEKGPPVPVRLAYAGLAASLSIAYLMPVEWLLIEAVALRIVLAVAVLCTPIFFSGIIFVTSFARAGFRGEALGSNLFGALLGGLVESVSLWTGLKSLLLVAAALYAFSWWARRGDVGDA